MEFTLMSYERAIRNYASKNNVGAQEALNRFVYNLAIMRPHFEGFDDSVDFRQLGQQWNKLSSEKRLAQKDKVMAQVARPTKTLKEV